MRLAPLALAFLAACTQAKPTYSVSRVVGTWAHIARTGVGRLKPPAELVREANVGLAQTGYCVTESFLPDGTWITRHDAPKEDRFNWSLVADEADSITVCIEFPAQLGGPMLRTLAFESPDLLLDVRGAYTGMRLARVPDPK